MANYLTVYLKRCLNQPPYLISIFYSSSGKYGGSIREAGGAFADREKAKEDQYFYNLQKDQLKRLKEDSKKKIKYHREQIEKHEEAIRQEDEKFKDRQG